MTDKYEKVITVEYQKGKSNGDNIFLPFVRAYCPSGRMVIYLFGKEA